MKKNTFVKKVSTYLKGTTLKLYNQYTRENEIPDAEYLRSLIREDLKKRFNLGDGIKKLQG